LPYPESAIKVSLPDTPRVCGVVTGIPDDQAGLLAELLTEGLRLHRLGHPAEDIRRVVLSLARAGCRLPLFSHGGVVECLDAVLAKRAPA
jgi:hypothetical protein